jgi:DNA-binding cell septation regulator SpoVG
MQIQIANIRIFPVRPIDGLIAFASAIINEGLYIGSIAIHEKKDGSGYRITYPTRKSKGKDLNLFHPVTQECSKVIEDAILNEYLLFAKTVNHDWYHSANIAHTSL